MVCLVVGLHDEVSGRDDERGVGPLVFLLHVRAWEKKNSEGIRRVSSGSLHGDVVSCQGERLRGRGISCFLLVWIRDIAIFDRKQFVFLFEI